MMTSVPQMETIKNTAMLLNLPEHFVRKLVKEEKIHFVTSGKKVLVNVDRFIEYLNTPIQAETSQPKVRAL